MKKGIMEYVLALRECGYPAAAAEKCGVTSSTLISSLKRMEEELGVLLYDRTSRTLTEAGIIYADISRQILQEDERLRKAISQLQPKKLVIGSTSYVDHRITSKLSMELFPLVADEGNVSLVEYPSDEPPAELWEGGLDLFFSCQGPSPSNRLVFVPFLSTPLFLAVPPECSINPQRPMSGVAGLKLISMFQGTILQHQQYTLARKAGREPELLMETNSAVLTDNLVSGGAGYAIVNIGTAHNLYHCNLYPIPGSRFVMGVWLSKEKEKQPQVKKIFRLLKKCAEDLYENIPEVTLLFKEGEEPDVS